MSRPKMTPSDRGQIAALARWAVEDPAANAARGQAGLRAKFLAEVDTDAAARGEALPEAERQRRADVRYRLHFKRMAVERENARRARKGGGDSRACA